MKSFLEYVAEDIIRKYGTDLSQTVVVFPNKRASLFLNEHLARLAGRPLWSPAYITISELFRRQSTLTVADPIKLVCDLYVAFSRQTGSDESLDKFYGWGELLLADFDDIDKNMADADKVFSNVSDLHELDDLSFLTDEQREVLRRFFSNFTDGQDTELKQRFLRLWSHIADIYLDYGQLLAEQQLAYEGKLYRQVVESLADNDTDITERFPATRYLFVGFNLLQQVEQRLFSQLQKAGKAYFYWDFDHYYMQHHEAGQYIAQYLHHFPNELDSNDEAIYRNFRREKHISYIAAPTEDFQARYVTTWLREKAEGDNEQRAAHGRRTAIVLCNESLLPTVIHALPPEVTKANITTGYPLLHTPIASFIQRYYDMLLGGRTPRLVRLFLRHPYAKYIEWEDENVPLLTLLRQIARNADISDPLFQESLFRAYTVVNRLNGLVDSGSLCVDNHTLQRLTEQLIRQTSIPFHGEPAEGVQLMGVLETRNIDFDHVLLLSCNEGNMPRGINDSSFIPHSIRYAYGLTTVDNKVSIYAYYFHRLLQRANDVTILYNSATTDGHRGEPSRFMLQLLAEGRHSISRSALRGSLSVTRRLPVAIPKTTSVMNVLLTQFSMLSPTAVSNYLRCPIRFYYRYMADIRQPEQPADEQELDNRFFGNIFHDAAHFLYRQLPRQVDKAVLNHLLEQPAVIERAVDEAFNRTLPYSPRNGLHLINREVVVHYLRQLVRADLRLAPFTIVGLESDVAAPLASLYPPQQSLPPSLTVCGRIDRLDLVCEGTSEERLRVIDYKTGGTFLKPLNDVDDIFSPEKIHDHSDYYLQAFLYADIVSRKENRPVSPGLYFIQHANGDDYDPTLCFGRTPVRDIAEYSTRFGELLQQTIVEIFSPDIPFQPTSDIRNCKSCPYAALCGERR